MVRPAQDEFESTTENAALVELLRRRIDAEGAISFHEMTGVGGGNAGPGQNEGAWARAW